MLELYNPSSDADDTLRFKEYDRNGILFFFFLGRVLGEITLLGHWYTKAVKQPRLTYG
jgi:hypothetical protein